MATKAARGHVSLYDENYAYNFDADSYLFLVLEIDHTIQQDGRNFNRRHVADGLRNRMY